MATVKLTSTIMDLVEMVDAATVMVKPHHHYPPHVKNSIPKEVKDNMVTHAIYDYAKEHHIPMNDGETYRLIHARIVESKPKLHTLDELKNYAGELLDKFLKEFDFKEVRVFAYCPLISTKAYHGFQEVYLYQHVHDAMGCTAQAFCKMNQINESLDKVILQHEFKNAYGERFGFFGFSTFDGGADALIHFMQLVRKHFFDKEYIKVLEEDIKDTLIGMGDQYFHKLDLTDKDNILLLYEVCGITYGFHEYRIDLFQEYDGYGNVVYSHNKDHIINDHNYLEALVK